MGHARHPVAAPGMYGRRVAVPAPPRPCLSCVMGRPAIRAIVTIGLGLMVSVGAFAQRGGGLGMPFGFRASNNTPYDGQFVFVRMSYPWTGFREPAWAHDYPTGEGHFMKILTAVSNVPAHVDSTNVFSFSDPEMFKFPVMYLVEPGFWQMTDQEVSALREYLLKGGFLIVDDFPDRAWPNFDYQMSRVIPEGQWRDLDITHPIWHSFFELTSLNLPPSYNLGPSPVFRALFEDNDPQKRMYAIANFQHDLSEYWEFSEQGRYPIDLSNEAYKFGVNEFIYGITH
jgi:hypothetical protein